MVDSIARHPPLRGPTVFVASPGDLLDLRSRIVTLLRSFDASRDVAPFTWETEERGRDLDFALPAQEQLPLPSDPNCRGVICLFGERIGTPIADSAFAREVVTFARTKVNGRRYHLEIEWQEDAEKHGAFPLTGTVFETLAALMANEAAAQGRRSTLPIFLGVVGDATVLDEDPRSKKNWGFGRHWNEITKLQDRRLTDRWFSQTTQLHNFIMFVSGIHNVAPTLLTAEGGETKIRDWLERSVFGVARSIDLASPYKGLDRYEISDRETFFGRSHEQQRTLGRLLDVAGDQPSIIFIKGGSGFGKSSFLRAGILARLGDNLDLRNWDHVVVRPDEIEGGDGRARLRTLFALMLSRKGLDLEANEIAAALLGYDQRFAEALPNYVCAVVARRLARDPDRRFLLAIDQFEELFDELQLARQNGVAVETISWTLVLAAIEQLAGLPQAALMMTLQTSRVAAVETHPLVQGLYERSAKIDLSELPVLADIIRRPLEKRGVLRNSTLLAERIEREFQTFKADEKSKDCGGLLPLFSLYLDKVWKGRIRPWLSNRNTARTLELVPSASEAASRFGAADVDAEDEQIDPNLGDSLNIVQVVEDEGEAALAAARKRAGPKWGTHTDVLRNMLRRLIREEGNAGDTLTLLDGRFKSGTVIDILADEMRARRLMYKLPDGRYRLVHQSVVDKWSTARELLPRERWYLRREADLLGQVRRWQELPEGGRDTYASHRRDELDVVVPLLSEWWEMLSDDETLTLTPERRALRDFCLDVLGHTDTPAKWFSVDPPDHSSDPPKQTTPIHCAALYRRRAVVDRFLKLDPACRYVRSTRDRPVIELPCWNGDLEILQMLYADDINLNQPDKDGWRLVHFATLSGHRHILDFLFARGADHRTLDASWSLLRTAAVNDDVETTSYLFELFSDLLGQESDGGYSLMQFVAEAGSSRLAALFLTKGADAHARGDPQASPLFLAVTADHREVVRVLLDHAIVPDTRRDNGWTVLHLAAAAGLEHLVAMLVPLVADISAPAARYFDNPESRFAKEKAELILTDKQAQNWTPLHLAAAYGHADCAVALIAAGADVVAKTDDGDTPLMIAISAVTDDEDCSVVAAFVGTKAVTERDSRGRLPFVRALELDRVTTAAHLLGSIDIDAPVGDRVWTELQRSALHKFALSGSCGAIGFLLANGADPGRADRRGQLPVHLAAARGQAAAAELLVNAAPGTLDVINHAHSTPAMMAAFAGNGSSLKWLGERGSRAALGRSGQATALHLAVRSGHIDAVRVAIKLGLPVDDTDRHGCTALHIAAQFAWVDIAALLLDYYAPINARAEAPPMTPLEAAAELGHAAIVELLVLRNPECPEGEHGPELAKYTHRFPDWVMGVQEGTPADSYNDSDGARWELPNNAKIGHDPFRIIAHYPFETASIELRERLLPLIDRSHGESDGLTVIEHCELPWYEGVFLFRITDHRWQPARLALYYLVQFPGFDSYRLDGTSSPIHVVNAKAPIRLNEGNVVSYLCFFCFFVRGPDGPFLVVDLVDDPSLPITPVFGKALERCRSAPFYDGYDNEGRMLVNAVIFYANALFVASFRVHDTGNVEMLDDDPIAADLDGRVDQPLT